jgi:two-component system NtrC family sensor kinase
VFRLPLSRLPLKARLISSYLVILALGGLVTSVVGSWIVSSTIMREAQAGAARSLATAQTIYDDELSRLERTVSLLAGEPEMAELARGEGRFGERRLDRVWRDSGFAFMGVTDARGRVVRRGAEGTGVGDTLTAHVVAAALQGRTVAAAEVLDAVHLSRETPGLERAVALEIVPTPEGWTPPYTRLTEGLALMAAAPLTDDDGMVWGAVYAGVLLNRNLGIVDRIWRVLYAGETYRGAPVGTVTILQDGVRVATTVTGGEAERALGTTVSQDVARAVLGEGRPWRDRAFVVHDWYLTAYEPLRSLDGAVVGMIGVGVLERYYAQIRDRVIISFFAIAGLGFLVILVATYGIMGNILRPIGEMADAAQKIAAGDFNQMIRATGEGEVAVLASSFNSMLESLRTMRADLEAWGRTLEDKVDQRSRELLAMQVRMARTERLASLGMLSAGVAHEINNPLGGVLALSALALEDLPPDDPIRENLEEVVRQAQRCKAIVKGLLDFSRQSASSSEPVDLGRVAQEALALVKPQAAFFNIDLVCAFEPNLPPVMADRAEIQQVILNIIMNAVQAMEEQGRLTLTTSSSEGFAELAVSDTGHGIPPDRIGHVFDPFFTTKDESKGTGLGLSIAYGIVSKHGGTIAVESEVGVGTTFTIRFPVTPEFARGAYAPPPEPARPEPARPEPASRTKPATPPRPGAAGCEPPPPIWEPLSGSPGRKPKR